MVYESPKYEDYCNYEFQPLKEVTTEEECNLLESALSTRVFTSGLH